MLNFKNADLYFKLFMCIEKLCITGYNHSAAVIGMNLNKRELNEHVEFESQTYYAAFAAELEACAQPMWGLLTHCKVKVSLTHRINGTCVISTSSCNHLLHNTISNFLHLILCVTRKHKNTLKLWFDTVWRPCRSGLMPLASLMRYINGKLPYVQVIFSLPCFT